MTRMTRASTRRGRTISAVSGLVIGTVAANATSLASQAAKAKGTADTFAFNDSHLRAWWQASPTRPSTAFWPSPGRQGWWDLTLCTQVAAAAGGVPSNQ
jgi:hypothetical protein